MSASCLRSQIQSLKRKLEGWNERAKDFTLSEASATQDHENNVAKLIPKSLSGGSRVSSSLGPTGRPVVFGWKTMLQIWTISTYELMHVFTAVSEIRGGLKLSSMFAGKGSHSSFSLLFFQPVVWHRIGLCVKKIHAFKMHQVRKWQQMERHELDHSWITFHCKAAHCLFVCIHSRVQIVICHGNSQQWQRQSGGTSTFTQHGWYLTPLSQSYPLSPRGMIMVAMSSLGCWASVRDGVVGFHFHLATFYEAKVGTNEHCWSVCSSSGAHKVTLFIDPALNSAPICGNCSLSLLNKCC